MTPPPTAFPCKASSVTRARHAVVEFLEAEGCGDRGAETAALLVSELATNAVRHARTPFTMALIHDSGRLEVEIVDGSPAALEPREPDDEGGRGLQVVEALAEEWGTRARRSGKAVYFRIVC
jgi:serine/threonine-protein kinase RsbW